MEDNVILYLRACFEVLVAKTNYFMVSDMSMILTLTILKNC